MVELQSKKPDEPKAAAAKLPPPPMAPASGNVPAQGVPGGMTGPQARLGTGAHPAVQPKLMPGSLTPPSPSAFPPNPVFPPPTFGGGIFWRWNLWCSSDAHGTRRNQCSGCTMHRRTKGLGWPMGHGVGPRSARVTSRSFRDQGDLTSGDVAS